MTSCWLEKVNLPGLNDEDREMDTVNLSVTFSLHYHHIHTRHTGEFGDGGSDPLTNRRDSRTYYNHQLARVVCTTNLNVLHCGNSDDIWDSGG